MLHEFADRAGVELITLGRRAQIDQDWLRMHAGTLSRTDDDIGAELGLAGETIRRHRRNRGLPGRSTGGHGHVVTYLRHPDLPRDVRRAVEGQRNGWQRLRRLQQTLAYPSINAAAHALGIYASNLNLQIKRLATDIGGALLQRAPHRYGPMKLTNRGRRLLAHLEQPAIRELVNRYADANTRTASGSGH